MHIRRSEQPLGGVIPTASMADIAFLLLIFFLVTTTFDEEIGLEVVLPEKLPEPELDNLTTRQANLMLDRDADRSLFESPKRGVASASLLAGPVLPWPPPAPATSPTA